MSREAHAMGNRYGPCAPRRYRPPGIRGPFIERCSVCAQSREVSGARRGGSLDNSTPEPAAGSGTPRDQRTPLTREDRRRRSDRGEGRPATAVNPRFFRIWRTRSARRSGRRQTRARASPRHAPDSEGTACGVLARVRAGHASSVYAGWHPRPYSRPTRRQRSNSNSNFNYHFQYQSSNTKFQLPTSNFQGRLALPPAAFCLFT